MNYLNARFSHLLVDHSKVTCQGRLYLTWEFLQRLPQDMAPISFDGKFYEASGKNLPVENKLADFELSPKH